VTTYLNRAYTLIGKTLTYAFRFTINVTVAGNFFFMSLPSGFSAAKSHGMPYQVDTRAGFMYIDAGSTSLVFTYENFASAFPVGSHELIGVFTFQIQ
jgi:hypothetical protein